jgi:peptide deformylase
MTVFPICRLTEDSVLRQKAKKVSRIDGSVQRLIDNMIEPEFQKQLATLRHCELVKGTKENGQIYLVPFD